MSSATEYSKEITQIAIDLLQTTQIEALLGHFGKAKLGGSYAYNLMVDNDLDFAVAVSTITPEIRAKIASTFASQLWVYSINMTDRANFEPLSHLGAPRGLFLGLTIPYPIKRWNIDVWFVIADDLEQDEMEKLISQASPEQKANILQIKYELMKRGHKEKGVTSVEVYKAVIQNGVTSTPEFLKFKA
jgi:hypothetical protein